MKGRRSTQSGSRRADEWVNVTVATHKRSKGLAPPALTSISGLSVTLVTSVVLLVSCCGLTESRSLIATEWQDYAQMLHQ